MRWTRWVPIAGGIAALAAWASIGPAPAGRGTVPASAVPDTRSVSRIGANAAAYPWETLSDWQYHGPEGIGAPTSFVGFHPDNASTAYAVSHGGDVFRSTDGGGTWQFRGHVPLRGAKLEFVAGQSQVLYAYAERTQWQAGAYVGLLKSTDAGATWQVMYPEQDYQRSWIAAISALRSIPGQPGVLWAATPNGLVRSADDGANWTTVYTDTAGGCMGLEVSLKRSRVYTACSQPAWGVIAAPLSGSGWMQLNGLGTTSHSAVLAMAKSNPDVIYLATFGDGMQPVPYAYLGQNAHLGRIYRTTDGGTTWQKQFDRSEGTDAVGAAIPGDFEDECQWKYGALTAGPSHMAVDPSNSAYLWISGYEIFRSSDGGRTFGRVRARTTDFLDVDMNARTSAPSSDRYVSLAFPPNYNGTTEQSVLAASGTGIERTLQGRAPAQTAPSLSCGSLDSAPAMAWEERNAGYSTARIIHGDVDGTGEMVVSSPDLGAAISDGSGPDQWARLTPLRMMPLGQVSIDPVSGTDRFSIGFGIGVVNWTWSDARAKWNPETVDFVDHGSPPGYRPPGEDMGYAYPPYVRNPKDRNHLVSATPGGVFESRNNGDSWTLVSPDEPLVAIGFLRDSRIIASTEDGYLLVQRSPHVREWDKRDLGGCIVAQGGCTGGSMRFTGFVLSPDPSDMGLYGTTGEWQDKVWRSTDGLSWKTAHLPGTGGLPVHEGSTTLAVDPDNPRNLYAGTPIGLFVSGDSPAYWRPVDTPFPGTAISRLEFHKDPVTGTRRLFAFTFGRGVWSAAVAPSTTFSDIPTYFWAHAFVQKLYEAGITGGCRTTPLAYCPSSAVARDQMAVFLLRAKHGRTYQPPAASGAFSDVPTTHWAAAWIERLRDEGITGGCGTSPLRYCPTGIVSRDQMAVFLLRAKHGANYQPPAATGLFADVPTSHWAAAWIEQLAREGIGGGCSATPKNFCPNSTVTRDQMAVFLVRAFGL